MNINSKITPFLFSKVFSISKKSKKNFFLPSWESQKISKFLKFSMILAAMTFWKKITKIGQNATNPSFFLFTLYIRVSAWKQYQKQWSLYLQYLLRYNMRRCVTKTKWWYQSKLLMKKHKELSSKLTHEAILTLIVLGGGGHPNFFFLHILWIKYKDIPI